MFCDSTMNTIWLLTSSAGEKPIGIFTKKEIGLQAIPNRIGVQDYGTEVIIAINQNTHLMLQEWAVNKALVNGEWKILTDNE